MRVLPTLEMKRQQRQEACGRLAASGAGRDRVFHAKPQRKISRDGTFRREGLIISSRAISSFFAAWRLGVNPAKLGAAPSFQDVAHGQDV
jgi:hypothetical protein